MTVKRGFDEKDEIYHEIEMLLLARGVSVDRDSSLKRALNSLLDMVPDQECDHGAGNYEVGPGGTMVCSDCNQNI